MSISLNVLRHLGVNLYSNVPAVIAEAVANAWDADAENVEIQIDPVQGHIIISDDGHGMSPSDVNDKYLHVGYARREKDGGSKTQRFKRDVMGRKGIGKLSLFSVAHEIEVHSAKDSIRHGFKMTSEGITRSVEATDGSGTYIPESIDPSAISISKGTMIKLNHLKKRLSQTEGALRRRLARRFSIIGPQYNFAISINGNSIVASDRDWFHKIQYLWQFGDSTDYAALCTNADYCETRMDTVKVDEDDHYQISGWIGTVSGSGQLKDGSDNLNKITIMVRGKLAQEDMLEDFNEGGMYTKYIIGEIHADFLDVDDKDDIATSSRQKLIEDDARYQALKEFVLSQLKHIQNVWTDLRNKHGEQKAREIPEIDEWFTSLPRSLKPQARALFGKINQLTLDADDDKKNLFKHSVIAFESLRHKQQLAELDNLKAEDLPAFAAAFVSVDDFEETLYYQIVHERIMVIRALQKAVEDNLLEKIIQQHLFDHLWLLDPSWERATGSEYRESTLKREFSNVFGDDLTDDESRGRIDIKYKQTGGKHVIVELKRSERILSSQELSEQVSKYRTALEKLLLEAGEPNAAIEIVCVIGKELSDGRDAKSRALAMERLKVDGARVIMYKELIDRAYKSYADYLAKSDEAGRLTRLLSAIDASTVII